VTPKINNSHPWGYYADMGYVCSCDENFAVGEGGCTTLECEEGEDYCYDEATGSAKCCAGGSGGGGSPPLNPDGCPEGTILCDWGDEYCCEGSCAASPSMTVGCTKKE